MLKDKSITVADGSKYITAAAALTITIDSYGGPAVNEMTASWNTNKQRESCPVAS